MTVLEYASVVVLIVNVIIAVIITRKVFANSFLTDEEIEEVFTFRIDGGEKLKKFQRDTRNDLKAVFRWQVAGLFSQIVLLALQVASYILD